ALRLRDALSGERGQERRVARRALVGLLLGQEHAAHVEQHGGDAALGHQLSGSLETGRRVGSAAGLGTTARETQIESSYRKQSGTDIMIWLVASGGVRIAPTMKAARIAYLRCLASHAGVTTPATARPTRMIGSWKARPNARYMPEQKLNTAW